jgi:hypothetical protein
MAAAALLASVAGLHPFVKYALVVTAGIGLPLLLHLGLVARRPWARLLFNGRVRPASDLRPADGQRPPAAPTVLPGAGPLA